MRRRRLDAIAFLLLYAFLFGAWNLSGGSFRVWPDLWQLLPWPFLLEDLGTSLIDLHSQPPLLNLLFGMALKAAVRMGTVVETLLQPLYFAVGAITGIAIVAVAERIVPRPAIRRAVLLLFFLNPYFYASLHYLFYTAWELLFLSLTALYALRYFDRPVPARLAAALAPAVLLVCARSLFHPVWLAHLVALYLVLGRRKAAAGFRPLTAVGAVALVLVAAWPVKNLARFGFFGYSSWAGLSMARGLPTGEPLLPSGYPVRLAAFARAGSLPPDPAAAEAARRLVPSSFRESPTLSVLSKPDGSPNWNHYAIIPISRELGRAARGTLLRDPSILLYKATDFYLNGYAIYEARWPYHGGLAPEMTAGTAWANAYEAVVFQRFRRYDPGRTAVTTGFAFVFPVFLVATGVVLWRRRPWGPEDRTSAMMFFTILWVLALVLFVDGPEGNRVRFSTEPYLFLLAGRVLSAAVDLGHAS